MRARTVLKAGERGTPFAHAEGRPRMKLDLQRYVEADVLAQRMDLRARAHDGAVGRPQALRRTKKHTVSPVIDLEHLRPDDPIGERAREALDGGAHVD